MDIILFDLGRTLVYFDGPLPEVIERAERAMLDYLKKAGLDIDESQFMIAFHEHEEDDNTGRGDEFLEYPTKNVLKQLLTRFGYDDLDESTIQGAVDALYQITQQYWYPEKDALPVVRELARQGYRLGIISNASDDNDVQALVDKLGVRKFMDVILTSAAAGIRKPNPRIFQIALDLLGASPEQAVMVGDRLDADILGAHSCGMTAIWITRRAEIPDDHSQPGEIKPNATIAALSELPDLLTKMQLENNP
jgi:putative hydrolase of the HAD superfamily